MLKKINGEIQKLKAKIFPKGRLWERKMSPNFLPHPGGLAAVTYFIQTVPGSYLDGQPYRKPCSRLVGTIKKSKVKEDLFTLLL